MEDLSTWVGARSVRPSRSMRAGALAGATLDRGICSRPAQRPAAAAGTGRSSTRVEPMSALGRDGHPKKGGFLRDRAARRMWAAAAATGSGGSRSGRRSSASRPSSSASQAGRTGDMVLVTVGTSSVPAMPSSWTSSTTSSTATEASEEEPALANWRRAGAGQHRVRAPGRDRARGDGRPVQMFPLLRATFNGHRIHYDATTRRGRGLPGLVVHGPADATAARVPAGAGGAGRQVERFEFAR